MATIKLELIGLHAGQLRVFNQARSFNVLACGRQWGKTLFAQQVVAEAALSGKACAWFSPTYKSSDAAWDSIKETLRPLVSAISEQSRRLVVEGGGSVECWSLDNPDSARGRQYDLIIVDEAAQVPDLKYAWERALRPMLAVRQGVAWFLSTPAGTGNYFYELWSKGRGLVTGEWRSWQLPTATNPYVLPAEIASMREDMSEQEFAQEIEARFITWTGSVFTRLREAVIDAPEGKAAVIGVDWAGA
jgi:hypothetical protein